MAIPLRRVCVVGAGNWGTTAATIIGRNAQKHKEFDPNVNMWVFEEMVNGRKLTEIINTDHENVKYLPGIKIPENVKAVPDLQDAVQGCSVLVFVLPHQFLHRTCKTIQSQLAPDTIAISLIKGIDFDADGVVLMSDVIQEMLGVDVSVLSGANIANEIAEGKFCESTIGFNEKKNGILFYKLFNERNFRISLTPDTVGPQVYGGLKNVIALGAGFSDSLDLGSNSKSALMRIGLEEMQKFARKYFKHQVKEATILESCGVADLITSSLSGRNRRVAEAFGRAKGQASWESLETQLLNGQKLQGIGTLVEVMKILRRDKAIEQFPFINLIHRVSFEAAKIETVIHFPEEHIADVVNRL